MDATLPSETKDDAIGTVVGGHDESKLRTGVRMVGRDTSQASPQCITDEVLGLLGLTGLLPHGFDPPKDDSRSDNNSGNPGQNRAPVSLAFAIYHGRTSEQSAEQVRITPATALLALTASSAEQAELLSATLLERRHTQGGSGTDEPQTASGIDHHTLNERAGLSYGGLWQMRMAAGRVEEALSLSKDTLVYLAAQRVPLWVRDISQVYDVIEHGALVRFKHTRDSMNIFLDMVLCGRVTRLAQLCKTDRNVAGTQLSALLNLDFDTRKGHAALRKNAFALMRMGRYRHAVACFLLAKPPMLREACRICVRRLGMDGKGDDVGDDTPSSARAGNELGWLIALLVARLVEHPHYPSRLTTRPNRAAVNIGLSSPESSVAAWAPLGPEALHILDEEAPAMLHPASRVASSLLMMELPRVTSECTALATSLFVDGATEKGRDDVLTTPESYGVSDRGEIADAWACLFWLHTHRHYHRTAKLHLVAVRQAQQWLRSMNVFDTSAVILKILDSKGFDVASLDTTTPPVDGLLDAYRSAERGHPSIEANSSSSACETPRHGFDSSSTPVTSLEPPSALDAFNFAPRSSKKEKAVEERGAQSGQATAPPSALDAFNFAPRSSKKEKAVEERGAQSGQATAPPSALDAFNFAPRPSKKEKAEGAHEGCSSTTVPTTVAPNALDMFGPHSRVRKGR